MKLFQTSLLLIEDDLQRTCQEGQLIQQDVRGHQMIHLSENHRLTIFSSNHVLSGARLYSHARQLYRNRPRLQALQMSTLTMRGFCYLEQVEHAAVIYQALAGRTWRQWMQAEVQSLSKDVRQLGVFLAELHDKSYIFIPNTVATCFGHLKQSLDRQISQV